MAGRKLWMSSSLVLACCGVVAGGDQADKKKEASPVLRFSMQDIDGKDVFLGDYQGDVLLMVNVASKCGLTGQYEGLEALYRKYKDLGLRVLAFPANNFLAQEPGSNKEIKQFCRTKFDVTFDLFAKVSVKGDDKCDLYKYLTDDKRNGSFGGEIRWNFQKFLINRQGAVVARFDPRDAPMSEKVTQAVEAALKEEPNHRSSPAKGQS